MRAGGGFDRGRGRRGRNDNGRGGGRGRGRGTILCTFYVRGLCTRGTTCRFLHDNIPEPVHTDNVPNLGKFILFFNAYPINNS